MTTVATRTRREEGQRRGAIINLRVSVPTRELIDRAARVLGKSRTEFLLDSARSRAEDVLLDQRLFVLDEKKYAAFLKSLDAPPKPPAALKALLNAKAPWEK
jgi:uncharacterized protein (DUF1778 family)